VRRRRRSSAPAWRRSSSGYLFILPALALFAGLIAYPVGKNIYVSFYDWDGLSQTKTWIGLDNYHWVFTNRSSLLALRNLVIFAAVTIPVQMVLGLLFASGLRGRGPVRKTVRTLYFVPVVLTPIAVGYLFADMLEPNHGVLNSSLRDLHANFLAHAWLGSTQLALASVCAVQIWMWTGFSMAIYQAGLEAIPDEISEAAATDGASSRQTLWHVTVPMLRSSHYSLAILGLIGSLKTFDIVYVLTNGGPDHSSELPTTLLFAQGFNSFKQGRAAAIGTIILVIALLVTALQLQLYRRGRPA